MEEEDSEDVIICITNVVRIKKMMLQENSKVGQNEMSQEEIITGCVVSL